VTAHDLQCVSSQLPSPPSRGRRRRRRQRGTSQKPLATTPSGTFRAVSPVKGEKKSSGNDHRALYLNQPAHVIQSVGEGAINSDSLAAFEVFDCAFR
jgi:hypothetical protein